jgi:hypothetical protein
MGPGSSVDLESSFAAAAADTIVEAKRLGYNATYFQRMVAELGAVEAARRLLRAEAPADGFTRLWELGRLDLSVEAKVLRPEFAALFSADERRLARRRLEDYGYRA